MLVGDISQPPCQEITANDGGQVTCQLHVPGENIAKTIAALSDILTQVTAEPDCPACSKVTANTPLWIQAWGGTGGDGRDSTEGSPGYAQMVTSIGKITGQGIVDLFFYMGSGGSTGGNKGGSGGAGTLVTKSNLQASPSTAPTEALLIAGGGGGGGGRVTSGCGSKTPGTGGGGGVAISVAGTDGQRFGQGVKGGNGGEGGGQGIGVGGGSDGVGGMGGNGGDGAGGSPRAAPGG